MQSSPLASRNGYGWIVAIPVTAFAGEMDDLVDQCTAAEVVCISATSLAALMHACYLSKRLRGRLPVAKLIVGLWDTQGDLNKSRERIGCDAIMIATLTAAQTQVRSMTHPELPRPNTPAQPERDPMVMART